MFLVCQYFNERKFNILHIIDIRKNSLLKRAYFGINSYFTHIFHEVGDSSVNVEVKYIILPRFRAVNVRKEAYFDSNLVLYIQCFLGMTLISILYLIFFRVHSIINIRATSVLSA